MDVWSGSHFTNRGVELGGLDAWLCSKPYGEARRGGNVFYASTCATGRITRLLLADVAGHGTSVAGTAADLCLLMRRFVNCLDQTELVRIINRQFADLSRKAVFATVVVTTYFEPKRLLTVCNAGHPRPLIYRAAKQQWDYLSQGDLPPATGVRNLPLGIRTASDYDQIDLEMHVGDCVVTYTDALIESQDADGQRLGEAGLLRIMRLLGDVDAGQLIGTLLAEIEDRYPENLSCDEVSMVVLRVNGRKLQFTFKQKVGAILQAGVGLFRRGERPPLPDFVLANIGGGLFPALSRRWRGAGRRGPTVPPEPPVPLERS